MSPGRPHQGVDVGLMIQSVAELTLLPHMQPQSGPRGVSHQCLPSVFQRRVLDSIVHPAAQGLIEGLGAGTVCMSSLFPGDSTAAGVNQAWEGTARVSLSADLHGLGCESAHSRCLITTQRMDGFPVVPPLPLSHPQALCKLQAHRGGTEPGRHQLA